MGGVDCSNKLTHTHLYRLQPDWGPRQVTDRMGDKNMTSRKTDHAVGTKPPPPPNKATKT